MNENIQIQTPYFDRRTTSIIKGIALILMFVHHFFTFPDWWGDGIYYPLLATLAPYFCKPFKICVPVFCFITGYFYFFNKKRTYKYSLKKITDIYISYWAVFFIFAIIAALAAHYEYTAQSFFNECFAFERPTMIFCWYVYFYVGFMLVIPLVTKCMSKNIHIDLIISLIIIPLFLRGIKHFISWGIYAEILASLISWFPTVLIGYIFANYGLFEKMEKLNNRLIKNKVVNTIFMFIVALCVPMGRKVEPVITLSFTKFPSLTISTDVIYAPIFIYAVVYICKEIDLKKLKDILSVIGKHSLSMWFVSCIFFGNCKDIFQPILYFPQNPVLVTIWGLILCFVVSYVLDIATKKIQNVKNEKLFSKD